MNDNYGRKAAFSLFFAALGVFVLGLLTSTAKWGAPEHYDAPWWKFVIAAALIIGFGANGLHRFGEWYIWHTRSRRRELPHFGAR